MVSMTKGKHTLSIGGEFALDKTMFWANLYNFGDVNFATSAPTSTGNVISDCVTGQASSFEQDTPYTTLLSTWHTAVFVQDNYRITPRFTANLGIRWDIDTPPVDSLNRTASFVPGQQSTVTPAAPKGLLFPGDTGVGRGIISTRFHHIAPRVGFAWDPFGDGKTSIRAAAGHLLRHYQRQRVEPARQRRTVRHSPDLRSSSIHSPISTRRPGDFPSTAPVEASSRTPLRQALRNSSRRPPSRAIDPNVQYPYIYQFNVACSGNCPAR